MRDISMRRFSTKPIYQAILGHSSARQALFVIVCCTVLMFSLLPGLVSQAATLTVNTSGDGAGSCPTTCTLRAAVIAAASGDTIKFKNGLASPIVLTGGEIGINKALTITGPGATTLTISGNGASRGFNVNAG